LRAPQPNHATGRLCARPCPTAHETVARDRPWPSGTACVAGHAPYPAQPCQRQQFRCRRDQPFQHSPGTSIYINTHRRSSDPSLTGGYVVRPAQSVLRPPPTPFRLASASRLLTGYRSPRSNSTTQSAGPGRASPVPAATIRTFRALYAGESFTAAPPGSSPLPWPSPFSSGLGTPSRHNDAAGFT
jgi:hypothetical protein